MFGDNSAAILLALHFFSFAPFDDIGLQLISYEIIKNFTIKKNWSQNLPILNN